MELFIIIIILGVATWYSVRIHFQYKYKKNKKTGTNNLAIDEKIFLDGIENITILHPLLSKVENDLLLSIYGDKSYVRTLIAAYIAQGHVIIQGPPGTGKTSLVKAFSQACDLTYSRIQCTPDLLPQDILGNEILENTTNTLEYQQGPIFSHVVHVDEINRTTPKLQSAFLEAMQEGQISIFGKTYQLPKPFFLVATQNPYDSLGTYMLPYAQIDRFMVGITTSHLSKDIQLKLIKNTHKKNTIKQLDTHINLETISAIQLEVQNITVSDILLEYCVSCVQQLKEAGFLLSIRTTQSIIAFSKALAFLENLKEVTHKHIIMSLIPVLKHRVDYLATRQISNKKLYEIMIGSLQKDDIVE